MAENEKKKCRCAICGAELTEANSWLLPEKLGSTYVPYCVKCQSKIFMWLGEIVGYKLAMYLCCVITNLPYVPSLFGDARELAGEKRGPWVGYVLAVKKADKDRYKKRGFEDGITNIKQAFSGEYHSLEVDEENIEKEEELSPEEQRIEMWGIGPKDTPYSDDDYAALEKTYIALTDERPNRNLQAELAIQKICKWTLEQDRCIQNKEYADAQKLGNLIKVEMEAEALRKKDQQADDVVRLDDIALAVERAGLNIPDKDELLTMLANHAFHKKYPMCRDAADQMLMMIINATRWNEGMSELDRLPKKLRIVDDMNEFSHKQDQQEKQNYKELQLIPMK